MLARIENRIGITVDIPHYKDAEHQYDKFYQDFAERVICQNIARKKLVVSPPYTVIKRHLGTREITRTEVV